MFLSFFPCNGLIDFVNFFFHCEIAQVTAKGAEPRVPSLTPRKENAG